MNAILANRGELVSLAPHGRQRWNLQTLWVIAAAVAFGAWPIPGIVVAFLAAVTLGALRSPIAALGVALGTAALIGTGLTLQWGNLGVRLVDVAALIASGSAAARCLWSTGRTRIAVRYLAVLVPLAILFVVGLTLNPWDFVRADLYLGLFFLSGWLMGEVSRELGARDDHLLTMLTVLVALTALKALVVSASALALDGPASALQAWSFDAGGGKRTILVGGDTFIVLGPALVLGAYGLRGRRGAIAIAISLLCLAAWATTQTRTNLVGLLLGAAVGGFAAEVSVRRRAGKRLRSIVPSMACFAVCGMIAGVLLADTSGSLFFWRFNDMVVDPTGALLPSYEFRSAEAAAALGSVSGMAILIGRGLGAAYFLPVGITMETVWSHDILVWLFLKCGVLGCASFVAVCAFLLPAAARRVWRGDGRGSEPALGSMLLVLILISFTINRIASVEGMLLFSLIATRLAPPRRQVR